MLAISPSAQEALADFARPQFAERIRAPLAKRYVASLGRFPEHVRDLIVDNMLARAYGWKLKNQSSLLAFCEFMLKIAPNFDEEPELRAYLERGSPTRDVALMDMPEKAPAPAWERARSRKSTLPLFIPAELVGAPVLDQTVAALPLVLFDRQLAQTARALVEQALPTATQLNMRGLADAPLVVTTCRALFGPEFLNTDWMRTVQKEHLPPELVLGALRLRLAQDFGRFV